MHLFHRQSQFGPWVRKEPDGALIYNLPVGASDTWPEAEPVVVQAPMHHKEGCPKRGRYSKWVSQEKAVEMGESHHVEGVAIWTTQERSRVLVWVEPHLPRCRCESGHPHWGSPRPAPGCVWKVVKVYHPDDRDYAAGRLDKTRLPDGWPGRDGSHHRPHGKDKRWKYEYARTSKLHRAKKLGFDYEDPGRHNWREWLPGSLPDPEV
jgi:hypothetical protein